MRILFKFQWGMKSFKTKRLAYTIIKHYLQTLVMVYFMSSFPPEFLAVVKLVFYMFS